MGFDGASCGVVNIIGKQSPDIAQGVDRKDERKQGAGDQGLMFGYATNETDVLMPAPITLAHRLVKKQAEGRKKGKLDWLRPDAKSQVTLRYEDDKPVGLEAVVLSTQHSPEVSTKALREAVMEEILLPVLPKKWVDKRTKFHINPTGRFVIGGPVGDCGLPGGKIVLDTYGGCPAPPQPRARPPDHPAQAGARGRRGRGLGGPARPRGRDQGRGPGRPRG